uniref:Uncharacterized protein n=1 Tax=Chromera velia CCMP2878 TaxID=1169474 RepID=A0A0G4HP97_9ALVE|eukprot:Cvel_29675.t1-p1 / transcript=Cvel_29675.t1 / gene=Cvel_29675 / organism=Chromera_velia_CCMP2878 / gene_product=hypothetical protein / transcript_product=hypothetical protein / location=Cvel_scaffold4103:9436-11074(-) / protein_length=271 / sequence_SO=supercontig / SO=protein_coding / is_pseudo=false
MRVLREKDKRRTKPCGACREIEMVDLPEDVTERDVSNYLCQLERGELKIAFDSIMDIKLRNTFRRGRVADITLANTILSDFVMEYSDLPPTPPRFPEALFDWHHPFMPCRCMEEQGLEPPSRRDDYSCFAPRESSVNPRQTPRKGPATHDTPDQEGKREMQEEKELQIALSLSLMSLNETVSGAASSSSAAAVASSSASSASATPPNNPESSEQPSLSLTDEDMELLRAIKASEESFESKEDFRPLFQGRSDLAEDLELFRALRESEAEAL